MARGKRDADVEERLEERGRRSAEAAREADDVGDERARERRCKRAERDAVRRGGKDVRAVLGRLPDGPEELADGGGLRVERGAVGK